MDNQEFPECPKCFDIYGNNPDHIKSPKILSCGDSICKECLIGIIKENLFECPRCKKPITKDENIDNYITNNDLIRIICSSFKLQESELKNEENSNKQILFNIISLGNSGVGKTCIFQRLLNEQYSEIYQPTVGVQLNYPYYMKYKKQIYKLFFWDTGGQEKFNSLTKSYFKKSDGVLFVYDLSDKESFDDLETWFELYELEKGEEKIVGVLIGNKSDRIGNNRQVNYEEAKKLAEDHGLKYFETSAKLDKTIKKAIASLLKSIIESNVVNHINNQKDELHEENNEVFELNPEVHHDDESFWKKVCRILNPWNWFN